MNGLPQDPFVPSLLCPLFTVSPSNHEFSTNGFGISVTGDNGFDVHPISPRFRLGVERRVMGLGRTNRRMVACHEFFRWMMLALKVDRQKGRFNCGVPHCGLFFSYLYNKKPHRHGAAFVFGGRFHGSVFLPQGATDKAVEPTDTKKASTKTDGSLMILLDWWAVLDSNQ